MVSIAEAFELARVGNHQAATRLLKEEFDKMQSPEQRVELCEWIAVCFEGLGDFLQAAGWFEMAGACALSETGSGLANALSALREYEEAARCYEWGEDVESAEKCWAVIAELKHSYAAT